MLKILTDLNVCTQLRKLLLGRYSQSVSNCAYIVTTWVFFFVFCFDWVLFPLCVLPSLLGS